MLAAVGVANAEPPPAQPIPVLAELFTSEGCSSCPPADALLKEFAQRQPFKHIELIAVAEHVDYWDYLGWEDPFANPQFSGLQRDYARTRGDGRVHTPQLIINGDAMAVGNYRPAAQQIIQSGARDPIGRIELAAKPVGDKAIDLMLQFPETPAPTRTSLRVLVVESGLSTRVRRGENAGRMLDHPPIARSTVEIVIAPNPSTTQSTRIELPAGINPANSKIVAIWQQPAGPVLAAGQLALGG